MNLQAAKTVWILAQGFFLPLVLWLDESRELGNYGQAIGIFLLLEVLYMGDALLFLRIFKKTD